MGSAACPDHPPTAREQGLTRAPTTKAIAQRAESLPPRGSAGSRVLAKPSYSVGGDGSASGAAAARQLRDLPLVPDERCALAEALAQISELGPPDRAFALDSTFSTRGRVQGKTRSTLRRS